VRTLGIVGGVGPESTIDYYRSIIRAYRDRTDATSYPPLIINSIDVNHVLHLAGKDLPALTRYLSHAIDQLVSAGADFALIAANTPHIVFHEVAPKSTIPLISIVEATRDAATAMGLRRLALFGTSFTMTSGFYQRAFKASSIEIVLPCDDERSFIHSKYTEELIEGKFLSVTRTELLRIIDRLQRESGIDGVILAGTELPLLLRGTATETPLLDTTQIHVDAAVTRLLS
jgi:aspartate racemase